MIELRDITFSKGNTTFFQNFSLSIHPGEHWLIQGENGSGKTLLLHLLAGMAHPQSGKVYHSFVSAGDWDTLYKQRQEKIHFIPTHWLHAFTGGFDGLFYQQRYYAMDNTQLPRVRDVLGEWEQSPHALSADTFKVTHLLDLPITRLSNGQLKKVIILRQLARNIPGVLLLDYPFDGLDAGSRHDFIQFIEDISAKFAIQIILVDHGQNVPSIINRRLTLNNFRIADYDTPTNSTRGIGLSEHPSLQQVTDNSPVVEMQDLTIEYNGKTIISHFYWRINKGERWALTGRNGSGKTTLFSLIYADHPMAYSQKVFLFGKRRGSGESIWDIKKRINYLGPEQMHFLNPKSISSSGLEYISMQPHKNPARLPGLIAFFNAEKYIDLPMKTLSSGQLQMVLLINMFVDERELLLLDEPFQFLDPLNHARLTAYLNHYLAKDITLVLITHDEKDVAMWTQLRKELSYPFSVS